MESSVINQIINSYCIGCGICSAVANCKMNMDENGMYKPYFDKPDVISSKDILDVCPFSPTISDETVIAKEIFPTEEMTFNSTFGYYLHTYVGHICNDSLRLQSSSGGIITYILKQLLEKEVVTAIAHVVRNNLQRPIFEYKIVYRTDEIAEGASSKYYPVEMSSILNYIEKNDGKYVIVALPCFAKALRMLQKKNLMFAKRIKFIISPVCGHLKSANYADFLAYQAGISLNHFRSINFRKKIADRAASNYGTEFFFTECDSIESKVKLNSDFKMGTDWGHGMFKNPACDYCDDIVGEVADVSVGDAWIDDYIKDYKGNSVVIVRNEFIEEILETAPKESIFLNTISPELIIKSQAGGIRHKRNDLKYRLWLKEKRGEWCPKKRVTAYDRDVDKKRRRIIDLRIKISQFSHVSYKQAIQENNMDYYFNKMTPLLDRYYIISFGLYRFIRHKLKKLIWK